MASIRERTLSDGTKRYDVFYRDPDGNQTSRTFRRKRSATTFKATAEADQARGQWIDPNAGKVPFKTYATQWLEIQKFDPSTYIAVELRLRLHILPVLGRVHLCNIRPSTVQGWLKTLDMHPQTQLLIFGHVLTILNAAVDDELIRRNPCLAKSVRRPKPPPRKVVPWEPAAAVELREVLPGRYQVVVTTGAGLGLRQGESFGLSPEDIDWDRRMVLVQRQVKLIGGQHLVFAPPKYGKIREVPLPDSVGEWLTEYLAQWPACAVTLPWKVPGSDELVTARLLATTRERKALNRTYFNSRIWKPGLIKVGIEPTRENGTHALRHLFASVLLDGGENIKALSEYLGHADPGFTLRVYTHLMKASSERTRRAIDAFWDGPLST